LNDLTGLIHGPVDVPPFARHLQVGLVDEPRVSDRMPARTSRVREQRREALHPPVDADVIDLDPTLGEELLNIAIGEPVRRYHRTATTMILRWEAVTGKR
jgi:hypothetical protein